MPRIANTESYENWNGESGRQWAADPDRRDRFIAPVADVLLRSSRLAPGDDVLDIGCGCGATTIAAARAVGPGGHVYGADLSEPMLAVARSRLDAGGITNVSLVQSDAQIDDFPAIGVAISRFGTMFFGDPVAAFANIGRSLRPGGRLCIATWQPFAANPWLTVPAAVLLQFGTLPDIARGGPGMFAQSEPDVVAETLLSARYTNVELEPVTVPLTLGADADDAVEHLAGTGFGRAVLETVPDTRRAAALDAVRAVLAEHDDSSGVRLDGSVWIVRATRS